MCMIKLVLEDCNTIVNIKVNKDILCSKIKFFETMFTNFKERDATKINVRVPNAYVTYDIIMSCSGEKTNIGNLPNWQHTLESIKCHEYLGLDFDYGLLSDFKLPSGASRTKVVAILIELFESVLNKFAIVKLINRFVPANYDFSTVRKTTLKEILSVLSQYHILCNGRQTLAWNSCDSHPTVLDETDLRSNLMYNCADIMELEQANGNCTNLITDKLIVHDDWTQSIIIDIDKKIPILKINGDFVFHMCVSPNNKLCAYTYETSIFVHHIAKNKIINKIHNTPKYILDVHFTSDNKQLVVHICDSRRGLEDDDTINIVDNINNTYWDIYLVNIKNNTYVEQTRTKREVFNLCISPQLVWAINKHVVTYSFDRTHIAIISAEYNINIFNLSTGKLICRLVETTPVIYIRYSPDDSQIISVCETSSINIWSITSKKIIKTLDKFCYRRIGNNPQIAYTPGLFFLIPDNHDLIQAITNYLY